METGHLERNPYEGWTDAQVYEKMTELQAVQRELTREYSYLEAVLMDNYKRRLGR